ncbi:MAG: hypothetical protein AAF500_14175 [Myxococcota bacterium]
MLDLRRLAQLIAVAALGAGCSSSSSIAPAPLELRVELAAGSQVDEVSYSVTGNEIAPIVGTIETSDPGATASVEVFGIPPGTQYLVSLSARTADGESTCKGASRFDVSEGQATEVHVLLSCGREPRFGAVRADGRVNICAELVKVVASPLQTSIANGLTLVSEAEDMEGDAIAYRWTATGGTLSSPASAVTMFTCGEEGLQSVRIEVSDDAFAHCIDDWTVGVTCGPAEEDDREPTPALVGSVPFEGQRVVVGTWLQLTFVDPVDEAALDGFALRCNGEERATTVTRIGADARALVLNPIGDLPNDSTCALTWRGPDGPTSLEFSTVPERPGPTVPYDRGDGRRSVPFPDDAWLVPDSAQPTGQRLAIAIPEREADVRSVFGRLAFAIGTSDGYSPLGPVVIELSERPDPDSLPTTPTESLDPMATVGLFDVDPGSPSYGARVPFELYVRSAGMASDPTPQHAIIAFPSVPLRPGGTYAFVVTKRALTSPDRGFRPSSFMTSALAPPIESEPDAVASQRDILTPALGGLASATPPLFADDIALVTRFTVRSTDRFALTPLRMREQVQAMPPQSFTIDEVRRGDGVVEAVVEGTWEVPEWRDGPRIARDDQGLPQVITTRQIPFILTIPRTAAETPAPVTMYQHGNPGSAEAEVPESLNQYLGDLGHAVIGFTDTVNRELDQGSQSLLSVLLGPLLLNGVLPEFDMQTTGEQLAFLQFIPRLDQLDVVPLGNPDGRPDLDLGKPLTYVGISAGANRGQALVPYAPELEAAALVVGGARYGETLFATDTINPDGVGSRLLDGASLFAPNIRPIDVWFGVGLAQLAFDPQDPHNHASFMYANPIEVDGTRKKPSVLVQEGIGDTLIPNNATRSLAVALGSTPLVGPVAEPLPYLERAETPLTANVDANTTSGYAQYVPDGVPGLAPSLGCEFETEGHFCAESSSVARDQRFLFFKTALEDPAPTVGTGLLDLCSPDIVCDDGNPCTSDECRPRTGECSFTATGRAFCEVDGATGICLDDECIVCDEDCDDGNPCTVDVCDPADGGCFSRPARGVDCEADGGRGVCIDSRCVAVEVCGMRDAALETSTETLDCDLLGVSVGLSATLGALPQTPVVPGPVEYIVQTSVEVQESVIDLLSVISTTADVVAFEGVVQASGGSTDPAPVVTTAPEESCLLILEGPSLVVGLTSDPVTTTWTLDDSAPSQEITLRDIDLRVSFAGLDVSWTTRGNIPTCAWTGARPTIALSP